MHRISVSERPNWKQTLEDNGCYYHTIDGRQYWGEGTAYQLTSAEVDQIDDATREAHEMCMAFVDDVVRHGDYRAYPYLTDEAKRLIQQSWELHHEHLFGRFDFGYNDVTGALKLYEYNADTPTGLPEAAVWQWQWLEAYREQIKLPQLDQFNSIHEKLLARLQSFKGAARKPDPWLFAVGSDISQEYAHEDYGNLAYIVDLAVQAGFQASSMPISQVGWNGNAFVDLMDRNIDYMFKLYPYEHMMGEVFFSNIGKSNTVLIEPPWKMLLSTKVLLSELWKRHPSHPLLLEAYSTEEPYETLYVCKPMLGREGEGIEYRTTKFGSEVPRNHVLQKYFQPQVYDGMTPVIGSWVIGNEPAGIGIREDSGITTNMSRFIPHFFINNEA